MYDSVIYIRPPLCIGFHCNMFFKTVMYELCHMNECKHGHSCHRIHFKQPRVEYSNICPNASSITLPAHHTASPPFNLSFTSWFSPCLAHYESRKFAVLLMQQSCVHQGLNMQVVSFCWCLCALQPVARVVHKEVL